MKNPFEQPVPDDLRDRVRHYARDLAYGVVNYDWSADLHRIYDDNLKRYRYFWSDSHNSQYRIVFDKKWVEYGVSSKLLDVFGYTIDISSGLGVLTEKAFDLLDQPLTPPNIFISYRRNESSAFGLLLEARLKMIGNANPFIDKNLKGGEEWHARLEVQVKNCEYFICLIGETTLESPYVRKEIEWATESNSIIVPILHHGVQMQDNFPAAIQNKHAIFVDSESALHYESAVNQVLNSLGYATY